MPSFGTLKADTLTHSTAGSLATNYVVQGSAKAWMSLDGSGTIEVKDSFNMTSATDNGTGEYTMTMTNAMNNSLYTLSIFSKRATSTNLAGFQHNDGTNTTTAYKTIFIEHDNDPFQDVDLCGSTVHGDHA